MLDVGGIVPVLGPRKGRVMGELTRHWLLHPSFWGNRLVKYAALLMAAFLAFVVIQTPLSLGQQLAFAAIAFSTAYILNRLSAGRWVTLVLMCISVIASLRYMYWRVSATLGFEHWMDAAFGYGLLMAEFFALTVMLLGYFQTAWPLRRKPVMLPSDIDEWPAVDLYIPTYNEPLKVVQQTVLAALSQDWPADRLRIYVLDDGRRPEFRAFCEEAGVGYLTRSDNKHAKAGNINAALAQTKGEFIAIFDCDHIPTRSFLQICMGWFLKDPKLAMLQTPHVFFSPDPFEQNLEVFHSVPNEGQLFYGLVQDGNDLWNASFFCGSCAVLRREHLLHIGGMAVESVTEDALTALKMNRAGFNTAYLAIPQAAGLATESLSRHIGQRMRWARGMAQIFRNNNPFLGKGLSFSQRLCYASAALHFFYSLPRLVFLTAPLAYLFAGAQVFHASALMVAAYALPHVLHAHMTNTRLQGKFRHSFWNEVYEAVLAWYLMGPTLVTLIKPDKASFNVTQKGGIKDEAYFDWALARPYIALLLLNLGGMMVGVYALITHFNDLSVVLTVVLNMSWTLHNMVICSASIAVAGERRQIRNAPRVAVELPASLRLPTGHRIACSTSDFSQDGLGLVLPVPIELHVGDQVTVSLFRGHEERSFPATVRFLGDKRVGLNLDGLSLRQQVEYAQMTFARANIWADFWNASVPDAPLRAIGDIGRIGWRGFRILVSESLRALRRERKSGAHQSTEAA